MTLSTGRKSPPRIQAVARAARRGFLGFLLTIIALHACRSQLPEAAHYPTDALYPRLTSSFPDLVVAESTGRLLVLDWRLNQRWSLDLSDGAREDQPPNVLVYNPMYSGPRPAPQRVAYAAPFGIDGPTAALTKVDIATGEVLWTYGEPGMRVEPLAADNAAVFVALSRADSKPIGQVRHPAAYPAPYPSGRRPPERSGSSRLIGAVSSHDGQLVWTADGDLGTAESSMAVHRERRGVRYSHPEGRRLEATDALIVAAPSGDETTVTNLDVVNGSVRWRKVVTSARRGRIQLDPSAYPHDDDRVLLVTDRALDGDATASLYALNKASGDVAWRYDSEAGALSDVVAAGQLLVFAETAPPADRLGDAYVIALDARTGSERWRAPTGARRPLVPLVVRRYEDSGSPGVETYCPTRPRSPDRSRPNRLALFSCAIFTVDTDGGRMRAFSAQSGDTIWTVQPDQDGRHGVGWAVTEPGILVSSGEPAIATLHRWEDGVKTRTYRATSAITTGPQLGGAGGNRAYIGTHGDGVFALELP